jgi:hypothetical protein
MAPSSTYIVRSRNDHVFVISKRLAVYIAERIGDKGEPCGVPLVISKGWDSCPPPLSVAFLTERKDSTQVHIPDGKPLLRGPASFWLGCPLHWRGKGTLITPTRPSNFQSPYLGKEVT